MIKVVTNRNVLYCQQRLILHQYDNVTIERKWDFGTIKNAFYFRIFKKQRQDWYYKHSPLPLLDNKIDLYHFYNAVSSSSKPWITHMESEFNSYIYPKFRHNHYDYLRRSNCFKILPLSEWAYRHQIRCLEDENINCYNDIIHKMEVLLPPQRLFVNKPIGYNYINSPIKLIFVGNGFFRKGGLELLEALDTIWTTKNDTSLFELTLISSLINDDYPAYDAGEKYNRCLYLLEKHKTHITYYKQLPNKDVLSLIKEHHIGLLPSFLENFGYAALEYMANGLPIITTNQRAFGEINHENRGWIVNLELVRESIVDRTNDMKRKRASDILTEGLIEIFRSIIANPHFIQLKSKNAIKYIKEKHSIEDYQNKIINIYLDAINNK